MGYLAHMFYLPIRKTPYLIFLILFYALNHPLKGFPSLLPFAPSTRNSRWCQSCHVLTISLTGRNFNCSATVASQGYSRTTNVCIAGANSVCSLISLATALFSQTFIFLKKMLTAPIVPLFTIGTILHTLAEYSVGNWTRVVL